MEKQKQERLAAFRAELSELLTRHGAELDVTVEGDTHGVDDAYIDVIFKPSQEDALKRETDPIRLFDDA